MLSGRVSAVDAATLSASVPRVSMAALHSGSSGGGRFDNEPRVAGLRQQLARLQEQFGVVVIDAPPGTSFYTLAVVAATDGMVTPMPA